MLGGFVNYLEILFLLYTKYRTRRAFSISAITSCDHNLYIDIPLLHFYY